MTKTTYVLRDGQLVEKPKRRSAPLQPLRWPEEWGGMAKYREEMLLSISSPEDFRALYECKWAAPDINEQAG